MSTKASTIHHDILQWVWRLFLYTAPKYYNHNTQVSQYFQWCLMNFETCSCVLCLAQTFSTKCTDCLLLKPEYYLEVNEAKKPHKKNRKYKVIDVHHFTAELESLQAAESSHPDMSLVIRKMCGLLQQSWTKELCGQIAWQLLCMTATEMMALCAYVCVRRWSELPRKRTEVKCEQEHQDLSQFVWFLICLSHLHTVALCLSSSPSLSITPSLSPFLPKTQSCKILSSFLLPLERICPFTPLFIFPAPTCSLSLSLFLSVTSLLAFSHLFFISLCHFIFCFIHLYDVQYSQLFKYALSLSLSLRKFKKKCVAKHWWNVLYVWWCFSDILSSMFVMFNSCFEALVAGFTIPRGNMSFTLPCVMGWAS